jgi:hypothetical protein
MGPLPASRLKTHLPAFTNVGIDFFGPMTVILLRRYSNGTNLVAGEQEINRALCHWNKADLVNKIRKLKNQPAK